MQVGLPNGEVMETELDQWQIQFCYYMVMFSGLGREMTVSILLAKLKDDSYFTSAVARTWKAAYDCGYNKGYNDGLEELLG